jgi:hypothetical protein
MDLSQRLRATTEAMASQCSVPTSLWNEHSNACLDAIDEIGRQSNRAWLAETERDALDAAHKDMAGRLASMLIRLTHADTSARTIGIPEQSRSAPLEG